jgi:hypothetical protein
MNQEKLTNQAEPTPQDDYESLNEWAEILFQNGYEYAELRDIAQRILSREAQRVAGAADHVWDEDGGYRH